MNDKLGKLFIDAIEEWRIKRGIGTAFVPNGVNDKVLVLGILQRVYNNKEFGRTIIITSDFNERSQLVDFITHQDEEENNKEFKELIDRKTIKIVSKNLVAENLFTLNGVFSLVVLYHVEDIGDIMCEALNKGKFKLAIVNKLISDDDRSRLYKICPLLEAFKADEVRNIRLSTPVEEMMVEVQLKPKDKEALKRYNDYIATSINIFGDFSAMNNARTGDRERNVSAEEVCRNIAKSNGWSETLDMNIEYNRQIDILFNPVSLSDRAKLTYDIIRSRTEFLASHKDKLESVYNIVKENDGKRIIVINKKASFATQVRDYLKRNDIACECFHDQLDPIQLKDVNGNFVVYKSGNKAGTIRTAGAQLQCSMNMAAFNDGRINVLSVNNAPDRKLAVDVDIVIITSPLCNNIEDYIYRLDKVNFNSPIKLFTLYVSDTLEQRHLQDRSLPVSHTLLNNIKNVAAYDKINDVIVVD